jgi:hypothetical protein
MEGVLTPVQPRQPASRNRSEADSGPQALADTTTEVHHTAFGTDQRFVYLLLPKKPGSPLRPAQFPRCMAANQDRMALAGEIGGIAAVGSPRWMGEGLGPLSGRESRSVREYKSRPFRGSGLQPLGLRLANLEGIAWGVGFRWGLRGLRFRGCTSSQRAQ